MLPYLFPDLSTFTTVADLITHLRTSDARLRAALPTEFCAKNPPPLYWTLHFIVTRLPDTLRSVRDHFLARCPTELTVALLEEQLLAAEKSIVAVGAARGAPRTPIFEGCSPSPLAPSYAAAAAAVDFLGADGRCSYVIRTGDRKGQTCGRFHTPYRCFSRLDDAWREEMGADVERPRWAELMRAGVDVFALDYDAIIAAMYALTVSAEGDCYLCVPPDPGIEPAALGTSESALSGMVPPVLAPPSAVLAGFESALSGTAPTETALSGTAPAEACHTFTLDSVLAQSTTVLPCPAVPSGSLSGFHLPSFSTNLVSNAVLQDQWVDTFTPGGQRVAICTCSRTGRHLATFTRRPGSSLYTLTTASPQVAAIGQTLHLDVWGPARVRGQGGERYFLLVVDDYSRYTTVFPLRTKGEVPAVLIPWIRTVRLQLRRRFRTDLPVLRLHSDRGGEFSSDLLRTFCQAEGIEQTFTLPDSPQQNGVAERRIGLVMEVARTSLVHAAAPHFLWPFAVRYAAHQLNLWPRVSLPETSPTLRWTGEVGDASRFRVWGARALVRDTSADKLSSRTLPCVFLGFVPDAPGWQFYHPTSRRVFASQDVTFDESVPFYRLLFSEVNGVCSCKGECAAVAAEKIKELKSTVEMLVQQMKLMKVRLVAAEKRNASHADEEKGAEARRSKVIAAAVAKGKGVHKSDTHEQQKCEVSVELKDAAVKEKTMMLNVASVAADGTRVMREPEVKRSLEEADTTLGGNDVTFVKLQAADAMGDKSVGRDKTAFPKTGGGIGNVAKPVDSEKLSDGAE
ncbi:unnamed protein product [Closterium sp. Yama58-4]|nr:unnamed protein product [Closterium sp. Yama58-4]